MILFGKCWLEFWLAMTEEDSLTSDLTHRQESILAYLVHAYTTLPEPIGSKHLVDTYDLNISSATVRNEMAQLEELGYIYAPHTSAGRVPTARGYRYFVKRLLDRSDLNKQEQTHIAERFGGLSTGMEQWMRQAATILARTARTASLITPPISETIRFKHIELIAIEGRLALMVMVLHGGTVQQRMLTLQEPMSQDSLSETAARITTLFSGLTANQVRMKSHQLPLLEREVAELVADLMDMLDDRKVRIIYRDGLSEIINTFQDGAGAQQALRVFEERAFLNVIISEALATPGESMDENIQVLIAGEERWDEIDQLSIVLTRYGVPGKMSGTIGVLGPTYINYGRAISAVRYVSSLMTNTLVNLYLNPAKTDNPSLPET